MKTSHSHSFRTEYALPPPGTFINIDIQPQGLRLGLGRKDALYDGEYLKVKELGAGTPNEMRS